MISTSSVRSARERPRPELPTTPARKSFAMIVAASPASCWYDDLEMELRQLRWSLIPKDANSSALGCVGL